MLSIDGCRLSFELSDYEEEVTEEEFLRDIESLYQYVRGNPKKVTELFNRYGTSNNTRMTISLLPLGYF